MLQTIAIELLICRDTAETFVRITALGTYVFFECLQPPSPLLFTFFNSKMV